MLKLLNYIYIVYQIKNWWVLLVKDPSDIIWEKRLGIRLLDSWLFSWRTSYFGNCLIATNISGFWTSSNTYTPSFQQIWYLFGWLGLPGKQPGSGPPNRSFPRCAWIFRKPNSPVVGIPRTGLTGPLVGSTEGPSGWVKVFVAQTLEKGTTHNLGGDFKYFLCSSRNPGELFWTFWHIFFSNWLKPPTSNAFSCKLECISHCCLYPKESPIYQKATFKIGTLGRWTRTSTWTRLDSFISEFGPINVTYWQSIQLFARRIDPVANLSSMGFEKPSAV